MDLGDKVVEININGKDLKVFSFEATVESAIGYKESGKPRFVQIRLTNKDRRD